MSTWRIAGVQMDCLLGNNAANWVEIRTKLREAAGLKARLVLFPECTLSGYGYGSKQEAWAHAESIPGPTTELLAEECREHKVWAALGMLEKEEQTQRLFNACAWSGPTGSSSAIASCISPCWASTALRLPAIARWRCTIWAACGSA